MAIILAPFYLATFGIISGKGLASANIIGSSPILYTWSPFNILPTETPINTSAPLIISFNYPFYEFLLVFYAISYLIFLFLISYLSLYIAPLLSNTIIFSNPYFNNKSIIAFPAAPAPFNTIFIDFFYYNLLITFNEFIIPAKTTIAVPC